MGRLSFAEKMGFSPQYTDGRNGLMVTMDGRRFAGEIKIKPPGASRPAGMTA
jgi:hypothetical protein